MKSTIKVSISGITFNLDNDAYTRIKTYLDRMETTFSDNDEGREIVEDIEVRIAELLSARIRKADEIITLPVINEVLAIIGSVDDIASSNETAVPDVPFAATTTEKTTKKRLFRDIDHRVIGGVCSGLGNYFGIDRVFVRLAFILIFILAAWIHIFFITPPALWIVVAYIILWIVMPAARTMQEKMVMRNEPITPEYDRHETGSAHRNDFGNVLGRIVGGFFRVIGWFIVGIMAFVALILIFTLPFALATDHASFGDWGFMNLSAALQPYAYIPVWFVVILITFVICIPLIGALYGLCKLLFRFKTKIRVGLVLFLTWAISLLALVGIFTYIASDSDNLSDQLFPGEANYNYIEERPLEPFKTLTVKGNFEVLVEKADTNYLRIETNNRLGHSFYNTAEGSNLEVGFEYADHHKNRLKSSRTKLTVYCRDLNWEKLNLFGGTSFTCFDTLKSQTFYMEVAGAGKSNLLLDVEKVTFQLEGATKLHAAGKARRADYKVAGAGKIDVENFVTDTVNIRMEGAGKMDTYAREHLKIHASGAAKIEYKGNPTLDLNKSGAVKISKIDD